MEDANYDAETDLVVFLVGACIVDKYGDVSRTTFNERYTGTRVLQFDSILHWDCFSSSSGHFTRGSFSPRSQQGAPVTSWAGFDLFLSNLCMNVHCERLAKNADQDKTTRLHLFGCPHEKAASYRNSLLPLHPHLEVVIHPERTSFLQAVMFAQEDPSIVCRDQLL